MTFYRVIFQLFEVFNRPGIRRIRIRTNRQGDALYQANCLPKSEGTPYVSYFRNIYPLITCS